MLIKTYIYGGVIGFIYKPKTLLRQQQLSCEAEHKLA